MRHLGLSSSRRQLRGFIFRPILASCLLGWDKKPGSLRPRPRHQPPAGWSGEREPRGPGGGSPPGKGDQTNTQVYVDIFAFHVGEGCAGSWFQRGVASGSDSEWIPDRRDTSALLCLAAAGPGISPFDYPPSCHLSQRLALLFISWATHSDSSPIESTAAAQNKNVQVKAPNSRN